MQIAVTLCFYNQIRFQPNDHKTIKETADELKIFEGIKHPNLVRYFGVELHRVRDCSCHLRWFVAKQCGIKLCGRICRRRCTSSWSTVMRALWRRWPGWGCRNTSSGSTVNRSLQPSMSSMNTALSIGTSRVSITRRISPFRLCRHLTDSYFLPHQEPTFFWLRLDSLSWETLVVLWSWETTLTPCQGRWTALLEQQVRKYTLIKAC